MGQSSEKAVSEKDATGGRIWSGGDFEIRTSIAAVGILGLLFTLIALSANGLFIEKYIQDLPFIAGTAASVAQHGAPHVALVGPIGQANFWPYAPFVVDGVFSAKDILHANLLVSWVAAAFSLALLSRLAPPWTVVAISLIAFLVACSPRENMTLYEIGHLAPYNRWGWAIITPLAFYALAPKVIDEKAQVWRAALAGAGLFLLLFLKVTYFGAACLVMGAAALLGLLRLRAAMLSVLVCAVGVVVLELATSSIGLYLRDIVASVESGDPIERASRIKPLLKQGVVYGTVFVAVLWLFQPIYFLSFQIWWRWVSDHFRAIAVAAVVIGATAIALLLNHHPYQAALLSASPFLALVLWRCILDQFRAIAAGAVMIGAALIVLLQNHHPYEAALLSASPFLAMAFAGRDSSGDMPKRPLAARAGLALVCFVGLLTPMLDILALARHSLMSHQGSVGIAALANTPWRDLRITAPEGSSDPIRTNELIAAASAHAPRSGTVHDRGGDSLRRSWRAHRLYWEGARMGEAVEYLQHNVSQSDVVFSYYHANQFPLLLGLAIPQTTLQWWDYGRTFSENNQIAPNMLFENTTIFLEPKMFDDYVTLLDRKTLHHAWLLYGDYIKANFALTAELKFWHIWRRKGSGPK